AHETECVVTRGLGPRYLHSTGQLHKGGPPTGLFVQVVDDTDDELPIPGRPFGFGRLSRAQAAREFQYLRQRRRTVVRGSLEAVGKDGSRKRLEPVFESLAPEDGYAHVGPSGAGHFVKMVHNGIEYGLMQSYAEGFEIMEHSEFDLDAHAISGIWRNGSVVRSWLLELLHAAFEQHGSKLEDIAPYV